MLHLISSTADFKMSSIELFWFNVSSDLLYFVLRHFIVYCSIRFREGLSGIKVVIKTLSAGFHQPVERLRHVTLVSEQ